MPVEPPFKRAVAFIDAQNLFNQAKAAFGYQYPNFDPVKLSKAVCDLHSWALTQTRLYTGVPEQAEDPPRHTFWTNKTQAMRWAGVHVFTRNLRYPTKIIPVGDGITLTRKVPVEKGVDVRIALDVIRLGFRREYDVAIIFSQDQDFSEVADEIREISRDRDHWIKIVSAYPHRPGASNRRGIDRTDWVQIDQAMYDQCIDPVDYRLGPR